MWLLSQFHYCLFNFFPFDHVDVSIGVVRTSLQAETFCTSCSRASLSIAFKLLTFSPAIMPPNEPCLHLLLVFLLDLTAKRVKTFKAQKLDLLCVGIILISGLKDFILNFYWSSFECCTSFEVMSSFFRQTILHYEIHNFKILFQN